MNLGLDEQIAKQKYPALLAGRQPLTDESTVDSVLFQFLAWNQQLCEGSAHEFDVRRIVTFADDSAVLHDGGFQETKSPLA